MKLGPQPLGWANDTSSEKLSEILRLAELRLEDDREVATANDARATAIGVGMIAVSAAFLAVAATIADPAAEHFDFSVVALAVASIFYVVSAGLAIWAVRPIDFGVRGYDPNQIVPRVADLPTLNRWTVENYAWKIGLNRQALKSSAKWLRASLIVAALGLLLPAAGLGLASLLQNQEEAAALHKGEPTQKAINSATSSKAYPVAVAAEGGAAEAAEGAAAEAEGAELGNR